LIWRITDDTRSRSSSCPFMRPAIISSFMPTYLAAAFRLLSHRRRDNS
jgi:hypothetical protein